ncbi:MAG: paraquat-inducible protein A [Desulfuromonadaceae bacterium GWC2_58_13]|nr:MAG: paraquat-inducible protein A [Desulfuromonadaceae bacterium GWC2_58_13]
MAPLTARRAGLANCHTCSLLTPLQQLAENHGHCPRCGSLVHSRKSNSLSRCWAFLVTAVIFYFPANLLPMTHTAHLGKVQDDTILSGVIYFFATGSWPIALVIFIASVFVPLLKLLILSGLLISVQLRSTWRPAERTRLYRITELIGRWSMVDIYVVTILVALVKLGALAEIEAGPAAPFFALVVVLTMFAAMAFDPRLIWDRMETPRD